VSFWNWLTRRRDDRGLPAYLFNGRIRTSTVGLIVAFIVISWLHNTYQPPPPTPPAPETAQVVPPGFMPDPEYTWVPRTNVQERPRYTTSTTTTTTTTESSTEPNPTEPTPPTSPGSPPGTAPTTVVDPDGPGPLPPSTVSPNPTSTPTTIPTTTPTTMPALTIPGLPPIPLPPPR
jgi:hypothetical protein